MAEKIRHWVSIAQIAGAPPVDKLGSPLTDTPHCPATGAACTCPNRKILRSIWACTPKATQTTVYKEVLNDNAKMQEGSEEGVSTALKHRWDRLFSAQKRNRGRFFVSSCTEMQRKD